MSIGSFADRLGASRLLISTATLVNPMERALHARQSSMDISMTPYLDPGRSHLNVGWVE
jgi:hypothetical protein